MSDLRISVYTNEAIAYFNILVIRSYEWQFRYTNRLPPGNYLEWSQTKQRYQPRQPKVPGIPCRGSL